MLTQPSTKKQQIFLFCGFYSTLRPIPGHESILKVPIAYDVIQYIFSLVVVAIVWAIVDLVQWWKGAKGNIKDYTAGFLEKLKSEAPTWVGAVVTFGLLLLQAARRKRRPLVIDDPVQCYLTLKTALRPAKPSGFLDKLRQLGESRPVVILSSNEGIDRCFSDYAPAIHVTCPFPPPTPEELVRVAADVARMNESQPFLPSDES